MRVLKSLLIVCATLPVFALCVPANAADEANAPDRTVGKGIISELRLGIYDHNTDLAGSRHETSKPDINAEILFTAPDWLQWMAHPRLNLGTNLNTGSGTSSGYAGLVWNFDITDNFFLEGGFGGAIHDGETRQETAKNLDLGCRVLFHENASIGYRMTDNASVMVTVDHMSSAALCNPNPGLTDIGVRLGYAF